MIGIIGIGNILVTDDGLGIEVVKTLQKKYKFPPDVELIDGGTLSFSIPLHRFDRVIVIDAVRDDNRMPGEIVTLGKDEIMQGGIKNKFSFHDVDLMEYLAVLRLRDEDPDEVFFVGVVPADTETPGIGVSPKIREVLPEVEKIIISKLKSWGVEVCTN